MKKQCLLLAALAIASGVPAGLVSNQSSTGFTAIAQTNNVSGVVKDANGEPLIGATVMVKGTKTGTATDVDGRYSINAPKGSTLVVSYIGTKPMEVKVTGANVDVTLADGNNALDELVVVGYGQQKKVNLTGAVSSVDVAKVMEGRPQQDVMRALQGAVPGLTITSATGELNGSTNIKIRGTGTLSNGEVSEPLIVVDGVPMDDISYLNTNDIANISVLKDAASSSIYGTRAAFGVILITTKGAAKQDRVKITYNGSVAWDQSTYLPDYPNVPTQLRAALEAKANAGGGATELFGMYFDKMLPYAEQWAQSHSGKKGYSEMIKGTDGTNGDFVLLDGTNYYFADFDIRGIYYNNAAPSTSHNLNISGTSGKTNYYMSVGYDFKQGIQKINPDKRNKYSAIASVTSQVLPWLQMGTRFNFARRDYTKPETYNDTYQYLWRWGSFFIPSGYIVDETGQANDFRVMAMRKQAAKRNFQYDQTRITGFLKADLFKGFTLNADYTFALNNIEMDWSDHSIYGMNWSGTTPQWIVPDSWCGLYKEYTKRNTWTLNVFGNYNVTLNDAHHINVMLGANAEETKFKYINAERSGMLSVDKPELNLASPEGQNIGWAHWEKATAGYFGRINYDYKGIYLLELNGRYDGSSSFPRNNHWAFFPSGSLGYRFSEEAYFAGAKKYVSNGKIRMSYGEIGNQAVGDNKFISTISGPNDVNWLLSNAANGAKVKYFGMPTMVSSTLKWERIRTTDFGIDLGFLNNQLNVTFDYFQRDTKDMHAQAKTLPATLGTGAPIVNAGSLRTRGWEFSIGYNHLFENGLSIYANATLADASTTVTAWDNDTKTLNTYYTGKHYGDIWGFETDRYFEESDFANGTYANGVPSQAALESGNFHYGPGDIKFKDLNGDGKIDGGKGTADDHGDLKVIGNSTPRYEYGLRLGGAFKGFDLDIFFQGVGKCDNWTQSSFNFPMMRAADLAIYANQTSYNRVLWNEDYTKVLGYEINQNNDYPRLYPGNETVGTVSGIAGGCNNYYPQTKYLTNMAYCRLKNLTFGYTIPEAITSKAKIQTARIYFSGQNLFLLYKGSGKLPVDPEINASNSSLSYGTWGRTAPITRSYSVGVQVTF